MPKPVWKAQIFPVDLQQKIKHMEELIRKVILSESEAIKNIPVSPAFSDAIEIIFKHVHEKKGKLVASGMGKAGQIAENIATTFSSTGTPAVFLHPSDSQHGDLGVVQENDVLLLISNSGKTREIIELVSLSGELYPGLPLIVISGNPESELAKNADVFIFTGNPAEVCPLGLTPTTSTTAMTVIGDALVVGMMTKIGFTSRDYAKRHHGGYLGDKSRSQAGTEFSK
ncbi:arabinose-5-phosphate isomerase [Mariniphaga anaerophila]|uniref:Arabinose-5-phosphate isomerase n=2 Tax=Mariniphaga anaerophila TaxID=1484053 RepID=A0A1M5DHR9_9BACT|nr:arabinose-5-phosphate isomerase [Mariniphaga anaerophila]